MARREAVPVAVIALIVLIALIYFIYTLYSDVNYRDNYENPNKNYLGNSVEECSRIRFMCVEGYKHFEDGYGCGCEKLEGSTDNENTGEKNFCSPESRKAGACITLYDPVCGWKGNNRLGAYSNSCVACMNANVEYWTAGEC